MPQKYSYNRYRLHILIPWLLVLAPVALSWKITRLLADQLEAIGEFLQGVMPQPCVVEWAEFDKLPKRRQKELEREERRRKETRDRVMSQVSKTQ